MALDTGDEAKLPITIGDPSLPMPGRGSKTDALAIVPIMGCDNPRFRN
jgi:hypothetical protein